MPTPLTDIAFYAALCSDVYHHNKDDQWIDLKDIKSPNSGAVLDPIVNEASLMAAGFTAGDDGFYYTANGFGARLVKDGDTLSGKPAQRPLYPLQKK